MMKLKHTKKVKKEIKDTRILSQIKDVYSEIYDLERKRTAVNNSLKLKNARLKSYLVFIKSS